MSGILYGIGVGCGDPADVTYKAIKTTQSCDTVIFPSGKRAYDIIKGAWPEIDSKSLKFFSFPMTHDESVLSERREKIYDFIKTLLADGKDVGFATIGDVLVYSTFSYIKELAENDGFSVGIINGIPSFLSCAGKLGLILGQEDEIHIIPGTGDLDASLELSGIKIFMKLGKRLGELKKALAQKPEHVFLGAVNRCGMPDEAVYKELSDVPEEKSYLMTAFVR